MNAEERESGTESGGPMESYTLGVCGNADAKGVVASENCVHQTGTQMGSDGVGVVGNARKIDDLDAEGKK